MDASNGGLAWLMAIYWFCLALGGLYVLIQFIMMLCGGMVHGGDAQIDHDHDFGADTDADSGTDATFAHPSHGGIATGSSDMHIGPYSPMAIATFLTGFGGMGVASMSLGVPPLLGIPGAVIAGLSSLIVGFIASAGLVFSLNRFFDATSASSGYNVNDLVGHEATVFVPMDGKHMGQITFEAGYGTRTDPAKPLEPETSFKQGEKVWIVKVTDGVFEVVDLDHAIKMGKIEHGAGSASEDSQDAQKRGQ